MSISTRARRGLASAIAAALATGGVVAMSATSAQAAAVTTVGDTPITNATLSWGLSGEQGGGAFFGGCNFLSAGTAGNTQSSRLWTEADGFYKTQSGNVTVEKPDTAGTYSQPSWATKCQTPAGTPASAALPTSLTQNRVRLSAGVGSVDPATGAATISWTGSFTSVFYGGLTYWSAANPRLVVDAAGNGTLTATLSGNGADMEDATKWTTIPAATATLATLKDVKVDADGFTGTPTYVGTTTTVPTGYTAQAPKTAANEAYWGSFPQSFVDFQLKTGQSSYWYSSGGSRDAAKPASPLTVGGYTLGARPEVTVDRTTLDPEDDTATVVVSGKNFDPAVATGARPPLAGSAAGAYVTFGKFAPTWRPSALAPSSARKTATTATGGLKWAVPAASIATVGGAAGGAVELKADGTFTTTLTIDKTALDSTVTDTSLTNYGIYTYPGSGAVQGAYETYTPLTFGTEPPVVTPPVVTPPVVEPPVVTPPVVQPVAPSKVSVKRGATKKPTSKKTGKTSVTVKAANGSAVSGKVKVTFKSKGRSSKTKTVTVRNGKASVTVPKLAKGTWKVSVKYLGTSEFSKTATLSRGSFTVKK